MGDERRAVIRDMVKVATAPDATEDEREAALDTLEWALAGGGPPAGTKGE